MAWNFYSCRWENGIEVADSYPVYIGEMLDTTVYNEAVGALACIAKIKIGFLKETHTVLWKTLKVYQGA